MCLPQCCVRKYTIGTVCLTVGCGKSLAYRCQFAEIHENLCLTLIVRHFHRVTCYWYIDVNMFLIIYCCVVRVDILEVGSGTVSWILAAVLVHLECYWMLPSIPTRGHGLVLLILVTVSFVFETLALLSWFSPLWWWTIRKYVMCYSFLSSNIIFCFVTEY